MSILPAAVVSEAQSLVKYEHPVLLSKKEVRAPAIFCADSARSRCRRRREGTGPAAHCGDFALCAVAQAKRVPYRPT